jgi:hypothetical protein
MPIEINVNQIVSSLIVSAIIGFWAWLKTRRPASALAVFATLVSSCPGAVSTRGEMV